MDTITKLCTKCKKELPLLNFRVMKSRNNTLTSHCVTCLSYKSKIKHAYNPITNMYHGARQRAKRGNLEFTISIDFIKSIWPKDNKCPILGTDLTVSTNKRTRLSPSLDRIDNSKGYCPNNVQVISWQANTMKSNSSTEELYNFCTNILKILNT